MSFRTELLAPVSTIESFHAAIEAGADAVYCGLQEHNARLRAKNFTLKTLSYLVPYVHSKNKKIYLTLNTVLKQSELREVMLLVDQIRQIGVDAIIVQDIGLAYLLRENFPDLVCHASTQMAIHNSAGLKFAQEFGFKRVVLARELNLKEINLISKRTDIELEIFIHGALCYSISGLCLASSYLGGYSANRGKCRQICRRSFKCAGKPGQYFSPFDLQSLDYINSLLELKITSFKIEGRMKNADYVYTTVNAYRKFMDDKKYLEDARKALGYDFARKKTSFFLGTKADQVIDKDLNAGTGISLGNIMSIDETSLKIKTEHELMYGDSLRFQTEDKNKGIIKKIHAVKCKNNIAHCQMNDTKDIDPGSHVYLVGRKNTKEKKWKKQKITIAALPYTAAPKKINSLLSSYDKPNKKSLEKDIKLYLKIGNIKWLELVKSYKYDFLILSFDYKQFQALLETKNMYLSNIEKLQIELPPYISEGDLEKWKEILTSLADMGIKDFISSNIGQLDIFPKNVQIHAASEIWCLNNAARIALLSMGYESFSVSPEDDIANIQLLDLRRAKKEIYSFVALFISKIKPDLPVYTSVDDNNGNSLYVMKKNDLWYLISKKPHCIFHKKAELIAAGLSNFVIDFSFAPPHKSLFEQVIQAYEKGDRLKNTINFNLTKGLL